VLVLSERDVDALLDLDALVDAVAAAMADLSAQRASMPPRVAANVEQRHGMLAAMPAYLPSSGALTTKLVSLFPENVDRPTHQAVICCFDPTNGTPVALIDGTHITATRTAAGSALATKLLARADARRVAVIGTGVQAYAHARAIVRLPQGQELSIAGRDRGDADELVARLAGIGITAAAAPSIEDAVRAADIVCLTTHAAEPVLRREWLRPGTHVNSVGYNSAGTGEVDVATVRDAVVVVESRAATLAPPPSGAVELRRAIELGAITPEDVRAEIGELVAGTATGRTGDDELTLYKSVGVAVQDAAAAALVLDAARNASAGTTIEL
jgi:ornithine cyclodeaminase/alanine dehydrogenase-like protein (mu-crystallin family)